MNLKVPFVKLTDHSNGLPVWVNLARCQEIYGHTQDAPFTELIMNIALGDGAPYAIQVLETPEAILEMIDGDQERHLNG